MSELAKTTGNMDYITVHIDDQMDAKSMLGAYVCTAVPGEFVWRPGPLMQVLSCPFLINFLRAIHILKE